MELVEMKLALRNFEEALSHFRGKSAYQLFHSDPDGIASGANARIILNGLGINVIAADHINYPNNFDSRRVEQILKSRASVFVSTDLPLHQAARKAGEEDVSENVLRVANGHELSFIVDHHDPFENGKIQVGAERFIAHSKINYLNSAFFKEFENDSFRCCAAGMVYELGKENFPVQDWIAAIGIIEDVCEPAWKDLLSKVFSRHGETEIRKAAKLIQFGRMEAPKYVNSAVAMLSKANSPGVILKPKSALQKEFFEVASSNLKSFELLQDEFKADLVSNGKVVFFEHFGTPKSGIISTLSNWASQEICPDKIVAIYGIAKKDGADMVICSLRNHGFKQNGISMGELASSIASRFERANGGGHAPAASCSFPAEYLETFQQSLVNFVEEHFQC